MKSPFPAKPALILALALLSAPNAFGALNNGILKFAVDYRPVGSCRINGHPISHLVVTADHVYNQNNVSVNFMGRPGATADRSDMAIYGSTFSEGTWKTNNYYETTKINVQGNTLHAFKSVGRASVTLSLLGNGEIKATVPGWSCRMRRTDLGTNEAAGSAKVQEASSPTSEQEGADAEEIIAI
jgi:hypothetical protein